MGGRGTGAAGAGKRDWFCAPRDVTAPEKNESRGEGTEWDGATRPVRMYACTGRQGESVDVENARHNTPSIVLSFV